MHRWLCAPRLSIYISHDQWINLWFAFFLTKGLGRLTGTGKERKWSGTPGVPRRKDGLDRARSPVDLGSLWWVCRCRVPLLRLWLRAHCDWDSQDAHVPSPANTAKSIASSSPSSVPRRSDSEGPWLGSTGRGSRARSPFPLDSGLFAPSLGWGSVFTTHNTADLYLFSSCL